VGIPGMLGIPHFHSPKYMQRKNGDFLAAENFDNKVGVTTVTGMTGC